MQREAMGCGASAAKVKLQHVDAVPSEQRIKVFTSVERYYCCFGLVPWSVHLRAEGRGEDFYGPDAMSQATKRTVTMVD